jgi:dihydrodipicolinate synthase/N-acetylneuraminate lyase
MTPSLQEDIRRTLRRGVVIPAHPLALTRDRKLDERRQRALSRYYIAAGSGGLAIGVHTTQFAIRDPQFALYKPVLQLGREEMDRADEGRGEKLVRVAGVIGKTEQAVSEAATAREQGYHTALLSLAGWGDADDDALIAHCTRVAGELPIFGFYLQPSVGGRVLPYSFWRRFAEIENVVAIKIAPFNRYQTLDVVRAVADSGREEVALYTGNDDNIILDLLTSFRFGTAERRIAGGLLGHWAAWTRRAVEHLALCHAQVKAGSGVTPRHLQLNLEVTDANAAFFDVANAFRGAIAGIHEVLRRQGFLEEITCLDPNEGLGPGQKEQIDRVYAAYPHLNDDVFVREHLGEWMK